MGIRIEGTVGQTEIRNGKMPKGEDAKLEINEIIRTINLIKYKSSDDDIKAILKKSEQVKNFNHKYNV